MWESRIAGAISQLPRADHPAIMLRILERYSHSRAPAWLHVVTSMWR
jgi:hypothetical protein